MHPVEWYNYLIAACLLGVMTYVGSRGSKTETEEEYLIGNRAIPDWLLAGTIAAGIIGGGVLLVFPEYAYTYGISALWMIAGIVMGTLATIWIAFKFKPLADRQHLYSLPDLFLFTWGRKAGLLATFVVGFWTFGFVVLQLISAGKLLNQMTGIPYWVGVVISAATVASYLVASGFRAVVLTDLLQYAALLLLLAVVFPIGMAKIDIPSAYAAAVASPIDWGTAIGFFLLGGLNVVVGADLWQRIYAAKSVAHAKRGIIYAAVLILLAGLLLMLPPIALRFFSSTPLEHGEYSALGISLSVLLPRWLFGFGLVGALSTVIATLDTMVFILSMSFAHDFQVRHFNSPASDRVRTIRLSIVVILLFGCVAGILFPRLLDTGLALSTIGLVLAPALISLLFGAKPTSRAVEWSMIGGLAVAVPLLITGRLTPENAVAAFVAAIVGLVVGLLVRTPKSRA